MCAVAKVNQLRLKYSRLREAGRLSGTIKNALAKRRQRIDQQAAIPPAQRLFPVPLGIRDAREIEDIARRRQPRLQNWGTSQPHCDMRQKHVAVREVDHGNYSSRCRYTRMSYHASVRCCGRVTSRRLLWYYGSDCTVFLAPRGWFFGRDDSGLFIARNGDHRVGHRYHFDSDDLHAGIRALTAAARNHRHRQQQAAKELALKKRLQDPKLVRQALRLGVWVTFADSLRSGNCGAGTQRFCADFGLDPRRAYPVDVVQRISAGQRNFQVQRAIDAAVQRSVEDLMRGYCLLRGR